MRNACGGMAAGRYERLCWRCRIGETAGTIQCSGEIGALPRKAFHHASTVIRQLREIVALCEQEGDFVTREKLMPLLLDTEENHIRWLEQQLRLIGMVGMPNYLQCQMKLGTEG